jgi:hypothetical protein
VPEYYKCGGWDYDKPWSGCTVCERGLKCVEQNGKCIVCERGEDEHEGDEGEGAG